MENGKILIGKEFDRAAINNFATKHRGILCELVASFPIVSEETSKQWK